MFKQAFRVAMGSCLLALVAACAGEAGQDGYDGENTSVQSQALVGCGPDNAVPLRGPNESNRLGANACVTVIPPFLPSWWQYSDGTLRVQIANYGDLDPNVEPFPLTVEWENTCGTESGTVVYTNPWEQHELGHPDDECSIVMSLKGPATEDLLIFWGA